MQEDDEGAIGAGEVIPEGEFDVSGDGFLGRKVLDGAELLEPPDDEVVGENAASVLALGAVGHEPALAQGHHHVRALAVHLRPQGSFYAHHHRLLVRTYERRLLPRPKSKSESNTKKKLKIK